MNEDARQRSGSSEQREQTEVQSFEMTRIRDCKEERPAAKAHQTQLSTLKNTQLNKMETRIEKLRDIMAKFDEGEGHASPTIEAIDSDQQTLEAMMRSIEQAVNKGSNRNEVRDREKTRINKPRMCH